MSAPEVEANGPETTPEPDESAERDRLRRNIALTLAALVIVGAGLAILQVDASANESNSARDTTRTAVQAMRANVVANMVAGLAPELQAERDFLPFRRPLTANAPSLAKAAGLPGATGSTAGSLSIAQQAVPDLNVDKLLSTLQVEAQRLTLKQRALATTRITWNDRSTQYTTVIAVLAVALFLVGFGLIAEGPIRRSAYALGLAVGLFAAGWAVWIYLLPIPSTPNATIDATARGLALTANGDYRAAIGRYDTAIRADDSYAPAYAGRSRARLLAANPDYPVTRAVTDVGGHAIEAAVRDARRAIDLDDRDVLSFDLLALTSFFRGEYAQAVDAADASLAINSKIPDLWLLESAAQVALGDRAGATASLDRALALLRGTEPSQRTRLLASTYLSYLAWVERHVPKNAGSARRLADRVVARETRFTLGHTLPKAPPARGTASVEGLRYAGGKLILRLRWSNLPAGTALSALGYEKPIRTGAWTQPPDLALFATLAGSGERDLAVPLQGTCKPTRVRVDLYLNGARTLSRTGPGVAATC